MSLVVVGSIAFDAVKTPFGERARMLGGRTNHWGRISLRFGPDDFRRKSIDGLGDEDEPGEADGQLGQREAARRIDMNRAGRARLHHLDGHRLRRCDPAVHPAALR